MKQKSGIGQERILLTLSLSLAICMLGMGVVNPLLPHYATTMGASGFFLGLIIGVFSLSRLTATFFSGPLSDRWSRRSLIIFGLCLYCLSSMCYLFATRAWHLLLVRVVNGIGSAFVVPIAMAIGAEVAPRGREGRYFGVMQMAQFLGIGCGPLLSGLMVTKWGIHAPFFAMSCLTGLALLATVVNVPCGVGESSVRTVSVFHSLTGILRDRVLKRVLAYQSATALGRGVVLLLLPLKAYDVGLSVAHVGYLLAAVSISSALLQRISGVLADRVPKRYLVMASCVTSAVALISLLWPQNFSQFLIVAVFYGSANAIGTPATLAMVTDRSLLFGSGASMGAYNIAFGLGFSFGSILAGACHGWNLDRLDLALGALILLVISVFFRLSSLGESIPSPQELNQ